MDALSMLYAVLAISLHLSTNSSISTSRLASA